jgi:hypothetical protein
MWNWNGTPLSEECAFETPGTKTVVVFAVMRGGKNNIADPSQGRKRGHPIYELARLNRRRTVGLRPVHR